MRIDILAANTHPNPDSGVAKADCDPGQDACPFLALIGGMTAPPRSSADTAENPSAPVAEEMDSPARKTGAAPIMPFALAPAHPVASEATLPEAEATTQAGISAGAAEAQCVSSPEFASRSSCSTAMPAGDIQPLSVPPTPEGISRGDTPASSNASSAQPESLLQIDSVALPDPLLSGLVAEPADEIGAIGNQHLPLGKVGERDPSTNLSSAVPRLYSNAGSQAGETMVSGFPGQTRPTIPAVASRGAHGETTHLQAAEPANLDAAVTNVPTMALADPAPITEGLAQRAAVRQESASPITQGCSTAIEQAAIAASEPGVLTTARGSAGAKDSGARQSSLFPENRDRAGKARSLWQGETVGDRLKFPSAAACPSGDARPTSLGQEAVTEVAARDDGPGRLEAAAVANQAGASKRAKESGADSTAAKDDSADLASADLLSVQRLFPQNQMARMHAAEANAFPTFKPVQHSGSTGATYFADGLQPGHTTGTEIKSLIALLAPRQSAPTQSADFLAQLASRIQAQIRENQNILTIQLKPSTLGRMEIKAETSPAGVLATIVTESAKVRDFIEQNLPLLQQSFHDQGIKVERISVTVQDGFLHQSSAGQRESHADSSENGGFRFRSQANDDFGPAGEELALDQQTLLALNPRSTFHAIA